MSWLLSTREGLLIVAFFFGFFGAGLAEAFAPRRSGAPMLGARWGANLALAAINTALAAVILALLTVPVIPAAQSAWTWLGEASPVLALVLGVLILDLLRYAIHRLSHAVPLLWRLHAIHHADTDLDVTTSFRHHPGEYAIVGVVLLAAHGLLAVPAAALAAYAGLTLLLTPFVHANLASLAVLERALGSILVTPLFHAAHHARDATVGDTNFGMVFAFWDRLFGTSHPAGDPPEFGVEGVDATRASSLVSLLALPLTLPRPTTGSRSTGPARD